MTQISKTGGNWIAGEVSRPKNSALIYGANPQMSSARIEPGYPEGTQEEVDAALDAAEKVLSMTEPSGAQIADTLLAIAVEIERAGPNGLWSCWKEETGYPDARVQGETARTCGQLRIFSQMARTGDWRDARIDRGDPSRTAPGPKPDIRSCCLRLGTIASFPASNFAGAFGPAGVDFAPALAAGCPVIVKAHPKNPGTSDLFAQCVYAGLRSAGLPAGYFSLIHGSTPETSRRVVAHPAVSAVGFTGSLKGGEAILKIANARPAPIPVYAEMGSCNPVFILPGAACTEAEKIAKGVVSSVCLGSGQFCTNPGNLFTVAGTDNALRAELISAFVDAQPGTMVHSDILAGYVARCDALLGFSGVELLAKSNTAPDPARTQAQPKLFGGSAAAVLQQDALLEEDYGPCTKMFSGTASELLEIVRRLPGQLTATIFGTEQDFNENRELVECVSRKVGRIVFNGWPTGVELTPSMVHGGPWPASSVPWATSVGGRAIYRFVRPVCFQDAPQSVLPSVLRNPSVPGVLRMIDGKWTADAV